MDVHVRHRGGDDLPVLVEDGVMEEGEVEIGHLKVHRRDAEAPRTLFSAAHLRASAPLR
jgi:hypothetical protein